MLDLAVLRKDLPRVIAALDSRGHAFDRDGFETLEAERKRVQTETEELQARRNALSKQIGRLKGKGEDASAVMAEVAAMPDTLKRLEAQLAAIQERLRDLLLATPNLPHPDTPVGRSTRPTTSRCAASGTPRAFDFAVKDHVDVGAPLGPRLRDRRQAVGLALRRAARPVARLHRALAQFMLDMHTDEHGYTECYTPYIVNARRARRHRPAAEVRGRHVLGEEGRRRRRAAPSST